MDKTDRWKAIAVAFFAFTFLCFVSRPQLSVDSYVEAAGYAAWAAGVGQGSMFYQITGLLAPVIPLDYMAPLFGTLAILFIYLLLAERFGSLPALASSALLASAPAFTRFASAGIYSPEAMAFALFSAGAYFAFKEISTEGKLYPLFLGTLFVALAGAVYVNASLLPLVLVIPLALQIFSPETHQGYRAWSRRAWRGALSVCFIGAAIGLAANGSAHALSELFQAPNLHAAAIGFIAMLPLAAGALVPFAVERKKDAKELHSFTFSLLILSALAATYSTYLALFGAAFACAYAIKWIVAERDVLRSEMFFLGMMCFSLVFTLLYYRNFGWESAFFFALLVGAISAVSLKFYEEKEAKDAFKATAFVFVLLCLFISILFGAIVSETQYEETRPDVAVALQWAKQGIDPSASLYGFGLGGQISYLAGTESGDKDAVIAKFLLTNISTDSLKTEGIDYLLIDASSFDDLEPLRNASGERGVRIDSFTFAGTTSDSTGTVIYDVFVGKGGQLVVQANPQTGEIASDSYRIMRNDGESFDISASGAPLLKYNESKALLLRLDRVIYPGSARNTNLFRLYFGAEVIINQTNGTGTIVPIYGGPVPGVEKVYPAGEGPVRIFRIK